MKDTVESGWAFADARNTAVFTTVNVLDRGFPILLVTHDDDDGAWQFLCGTTDLAVHARIVALEEVLLLDPTVAALADMPNGWEARRESVGAPWKRTAIE